MRFKIYWATLIVGSKFTVFALFYFVFEGNFPSTSPRGAYIWRGDLTEGFLRYRFGGLIHGGAYFRNFTVGALTQKRPLNYGKEYRVFLRRKEKTLEEQIMGMKELGCTKEKRYEDGNDLKEKKPNSH